MSSTLSLLAFHSHLLHQHHCVQAVPLAADLLRICTGAYISQTSTGNTCRKGHASLHCSFSGCDSTSIYPAA